MFVRYATAIPIQAERLCSQIAVAAPFAILTMISSDVPTLDSATDTIPISACDNLEGMLPLRSVKSRRSPNTGQALEGAERAQLLPPAREGRAEALSLRHVRQVPRKVHVKHRRLYDGSICRRCAQF